MDDWGKRVRERWHKMEPSERKFAEDFFEQVRHVDELASVVLNGHLVLDQALWRIVEKFVHHEEHLPNQLTFFHRVGMARSMSLDEQNNSMWNLLLAVNTLRNKLAHPTDPAARQNALAVVQDRFLHDFPDYPSDERGPCELAISAMAGCLGFLREFEAEVDRFRDLVKAMGCILNPHRDGSGN
tara:strand:- start:6962 stop:7513 length:552 start_codon:yes stop_codon:yes gene_type:complete